MGYLDELGRNYETKYIVRSQRSGKYNAYVFVLAKIISDFTSIIIFFIIKHII